MGFELQGGATPGIVETQLTSTARICTTLTSLPNGKFPLAGDYQQTRRDAELELSGGRSAIGERQRPVGHAAYAGENEASADRRWFRLTVNTPDNRQLQWLLRTELSAMARWRC